MIKIDNSKTVLKLFFAVAIFSIFASITFGQNKKDDALDKVKGNVQKITIQTDEGIVTYEGGEAQALFDRLKTSAKISRIRMFSPDNMRNHFKFFSEDMKDGKREKIKVVNKDGEKVVTVTITDKDGKEKTETYKGKEADKYLEKHEPKNFKTFSWSDKNSGNGNVYFIRKNDKDSSDEDSDISVWSSNDSTKGMCFFMDNEVNGPKKIIKVSDENGSKIVTVTTTDKDGNEKTETYKGKGAEEYLKKNDIKLKTIDEGEDSDVVKEIIIKKEKKADKK